MLPFTCHESHTPGACVFARNADFIFCSPFNKPAFIASYISSTKKGNTSGVVNKLEKYIARKICGENSYYFRIARCFANNT